MGRLILMSMRRGTWAVDDKQLLSNSKYGVVRAVTLEGLGVPQMTTYRQCLPGGRWRHLLPGIVLLDRAEPTRRQRIEAALMHVHHHGLITGYHAARSYGLRKAVDPGFVHVLVPHDHKPTSARFATVERTRFFPKAVMRDGIPLAPPARAVLDGLRRIRELDPVRALLIEAVQSGVCGLDELHDELESGSQRGTAVPRRVLAELDLDIRSVAEADALAIWQRTSLPPAQRNVTIVDADGQYVGMPDTWCDQLGLAWEIDSYEFHFGKADYAKTLRRNSRYTAAGITLVQTLPRRLRTEADLVVEELRAAAAVARRNPRPQVVIKPR